MFVFWKSYKDVLFLVSGECNNKKEMKNLGKILYSVKTLFFSFVLSITMSEKNYVLWVSLVSAGVIGRMVMLIVSMSWLVGQMFLVSDLFCEAGSSFSNIWIETTTQASLKPIPEVSPMTSWLRG